MANGATQITDPEILARLLRELQDGAGQPGSFEQAFPRGGDFGPRATLAPAPPNISPISSIPNATPAQADLLGGLGLEQLPIPPEKTPIWRTLLAGLSEGLLNAANIRAGGQARGGGALTQLQQQQARREEEFRTRTAGVRARNVKTRERAKAENIRVRERREDIDRAEKIRKEDIARGGAGEKPFSGNTRDVVVNEIAAERNADIAELRARGVPDGTVVTMELHKPATGGARLGKFIGFADPSTTIQDIAGQGLSTVNPDTGIVTPLGPEGARLHKKPSLAEVGQVANAADMRQTIGEMRTTAQELFNSEQGFTKAFIQQSARGGGLLIDAIFGRGSGQTLSERFGNPLLERMATVRDRLGIQLARLVEPNRLSDQDRDFALRQLGTPASLAGNDLAAFNLFNAKLDFVLGALDSREKEREGLRPDLTGDARQKWFAENPVMNDREMLGLFSQVGQFGKEGSIGSGEFSGSVLREEDFSNSTPEERQRFIDGGGQIIPRRR